MRRRIVVLGGTSGIGEAVGQELRERADFDRVSEHTSEAEMDRVWTYGLEDFDIRDQKELHKALTIQKPTHLVYSIGVNALDWLNDVTYEAVQNLAEVNYFGFIYTMQSLLAVKGYTDPVSIVVVGSDAAWRPMRTSLAYCASKAALQAAALVAAREMAEHGWRINVVAPGKVADTAMTRYVDRRVVELRGWTEEAADVRLLRRDDPGVGQTCGRRVSARECRLSRF